jgi:hypothetical protein
MCIVGGGIKVHSTLRSLNGLLCQPRVITIIKKSVDWLAGETEVLWVNLPQCRFVHHKPHMLPVREPGPPRWEVIHTMYNIKNAVMCKPISRQQYTHSSGSYECDNRMSIARQRTNKLVPLTIQTVFFVVNADGLLKGTVRRRHGV